MQRSSRDRYTMRNVVLLAIAILAGGASMAQAQGLVGRASVIDGDTIEIQGQRIRMFGIDAPESSQNCERADGSTYRCGQQAAMALDGRIAGAVVACEVRDTDHYGRAVGVCRAQGVDLNGWMVSQGQAIAYTRYGRDYEEAERLARLGRKGIWSGRFEDPADYRKAHRRG